MAIGKFDDKTEEDIVAEINITPLTDIFLVLLIIFMITSSALIESGANINLPEVSKTETVSRNVVVALTTSGKIFINEKEITKDSFEVELKRALAESNTKVVILEGDKDALLGDAVKLISQAKEAGAKEIAIAAEKSEAH
ncbi:MAG TPA: biopolymer transporter ExbD [Thermodesulfobacteriota bacterium]|nr:biopolymer transporter ExbD [Thermodesulfobacteriota bacterium]